MSDDAPAQWVMVILDTIDPVEILEVATGARPRPTVYLMDYDPDAYDGEGDIGTTDDLGMAKKFPGFSEVMEEWKRQSTVRPLRPDGKPNRPLTAFTISPRKVQEIER